MFGPHSTNSHILDFLENEGFSEKNFIFSSRHIFTSRDTRHLHETHSASCLCARTIIQTHRRFGRQIDTDQVRFQSRVDGNFAGCLFPANGQRREDALNYARVNLGLPGIYGKVSRFFGSTAATSLAPAIKLGTG